ncbi:hypothetical protein Q5L94_02170 [Idiomarina sp. Sol25]|uniref:hypothetical protein n=1 Tax=Idiomarina sp. Sol25 TaxID=3064000 RepID=UPI00294B85B0|nr:hypothetical protein [Idiomarina sp. Sol25]MDV6326845.1 hypothetical protein [Idiomarina sp. Sol25]
MKLLSYEEYKKYCKKNNFDEFIQPEKQSKKSLSLILEKMDIKDQVINIYEMNETQKKEIRLDRRRKNKKYNIIGKTYSQDDIYWNYPIYLYLKSEIKQIKN